MESWIESRISEDEIREDFFIDQTLRGAGEAQSILMLVGDMHVDAVGDKLRPMGHCEPRPAPLEEMGVARPWPQPLEKEPIVNSGKLHRWGARFVIVRHLIDPSAYGIASHAPGVVGLQQLGRHT